MTRRELESYLKNFLNTDFFKDYCPNGLQVEGKNSLQKVGTAVSADLATLKKAAEMNLDALIVHHGLFWNQDALPIVGPKKKKIELLLRHQISLFAYHLPLDAHPEVGNNWQAAREMGWRDLEPFGEYRGNKIGVKGIFEAKPTAVFIQEIERYYGNVAVKALGGKASVSSAALISGGAYREIEQAAREEVDCFITGNFDEPAWGMAFEEGIHFLALGHSATEKIGPKALARHLRERFSIETVFIDTDNPF